MVDPPDDDNCSFWLTRLPVTTTPADITSSIRNIGRIFAVHVNNEEAPAHREGAGAKLVFFDADAARRFYDSTREGFTLASGHQARVTRNRIRMPSQTGLVAGESRVLLITGPRHLINYESLLQFFRSKFTFDLEAVISHTTHPAVGILEWRFCSYRAQAKSAYQAIVQEPVFQNTWVHVRYDTDPCDVLGVVSIGSMFSAVAWVLTVV